MIHIIRCPKKKEKRRSWRGRRVRGGSSSVVTDNKTSPGKYCVKKQGENIKESSRKEQKQITTCLSFLAE